MTLKYWPHNYVLQNKLKAQNWFLCLLTRFQHKLPSKSTNSKLRAKRSSKFYYYIKSVHNASSLGILVPSPVALAGNTTGRLDTISMATSPWESTGEWTPWRKFLGDYTGRYGCRTIVIIWTIVITGKTYLLESTIRLIGKIILGWVVIVHFINWVYRSCQLEFINFYYLNPNLHHLYIRQRQHCYYCQIHQSWALRLGSWLVQVDRTFPRKQVRTPLDIWCRRLHYPRHHHHYNSNLSGWLKLLKISIILLASSYIRSYLEFATYHKCLKNSTHYLRQS